MFKDEIEKNNIKMKKKLPKSTQVSLLNLQPWSSGQDNSNERKKNMKFNFQSTQC